MEHALEDLRQYPGKKHMVEKEIKHMTEHLEEIHKHLHELIDHVEHLKEEPTKWFESLFYWEGSFNLNN